MTPAQLMDTVSLTTRQERRDVEELVSSLAADLAREQAIAGSCRRLLASGDVDHDPRERRRLAGILSGAESHAEALARYVEWGETLLGETLLGEMV